MRRGSLKASQARVRENRVKNFLLSPHKRLLIKIIPHHTESIYKIEISHLHLAVTALCTGLLCLALMVSHVGAVHAAEAKVQTLQSVDAQQKKQLADMSKQTHSILLRLKLLQQNESEIRTLTGIGAKKPALKAPAQKLPVRAGMLHSAPHTRVSSAANVGSPFWSAFAMWLTGGREGGSVTFASESEELAQLNVRLNRVWVEEAVLKAQAQTAADARVAAVQAHQRYLDAIPSMWPTQGYISSGFGYRTNPDYEFHPGVDVVNDYGAPVYATASGIVTMAGWDGGYGYKVVLDHGNGYETWYGHNSRMLVSAGQAVRKGQEIAEIGATGFATGPHCHYEILLWGKPIDPTPFLDGIPAQVAAQ
jgi:murein DD-endopeptidase MepM/ murein hydrolase activator NlpD